MYICHHNNKTLLLYGALAQLVEQRTENPCVPGSIPGGTTFKTLYIVLCKGFFYYLHSSHKRNFATFD